MAADGNYDSCAREIWNDVVAGGFEGSWRSVRVMEIFDAMRNFYLLHKREVLKLRKKA